MQTRLVLLFSLPALLMWNCSRQEVDDIPDSPVSSTLETKVVRWEGKSEDNSLLVKFTEKPSEQLIQTVLTKGVKSIEPLFSMEHGDIEKKKEFGLDRWYIVYAEDSMETLSLSLASMSETCSVEYNVCPETVEDYAVYPAYEMPSTKAASASFNDPMLGDQWHYINNGTLPGSVKGADVNVKDVWSRLTCGDPDVIVAVADWGIKYTHADLKDNMWVNTGEIPGNGIDDDGNGYVDDVYGYNFVRRSSEINWENGHATHCAGTIAAVNNNGKGVAGIAGGSGKKDGCRLMSCQVLDNATGSGSPSSTARAAEYAADNGASVLSCSIGYGYAFESDNDYTRRQGTAEIDALHYFESVSNNPAVDGGIVIFAAGNENHSYAHYPGAYVDIISVSAFGPDYMPATNYTNYGTGCNISAPGGNITLGNKAAVLSTVPSEIYQSDWGYMQGTSMACPHVSGVVALGISYAKQLGKKFTRDDFKRMILASCDDIDQRIAKSSDSKMAKYYHQMGTGAIDTWRLMMHIEGSPTSTAHIGEKQWIDLTSIFGTASVSLTYLEVNVPQETIDALGLQKIQGTANKNYPCTPEGEAYAFVQFGRLYIHPTKIGSGKINIKAVGGGDHVGGGDNPPGGMELSQDISLIARDVDGGNGTGGWL